MHRTPDPGTLHGNPWGEEELRETLEVAPLPYRTVPATMRVTRSSRQVSLHANVDARVLQACDRIGDRRAHRERAARRVRMAKQHASGSGAGRVERVAAVVSVIGFDPDALTTLRRDRELHAVADRAGGAVRAAAALAWQRG